MDPDDDDDDDDDEGSATATGWRREAIAIDAADAANE
jgi:hypothetical protein